APVKFTEYMEEYWMKSSVLPRWSATYRKDCKILDLGDTNINLEFWHHFLKTHLFESQLNCRIDFVIYTLVVEAIAHFCYCHARQEIGFEGAGLKDSKIAEITK
ncbi:hypothetical protein BDV98DRAFT_481116, partial [Pterulicium gracile]